MNARSFAYAILALAAFATVAVLAHVHVASQTYHPVVKISSPEGLVVTVVQDPVAERAACGEANRRFLKPLRERCKPCEVIYARCERRLEGLELAVLTNQQVPYYQVVAGPARLIVSGPKNSEREACELIANDVVKLGILSAACVFPRNEKN